MTTTTTATVRAPQTRSVRRRTLLGVTALLIAGVQFGNAATADALSWQWRYFGGQALLNRAETNAVSYGAGGAAAVATAIPDPTLSKVAAVGMGLYAAYSGYVYSIGRCTSFSITWYGGVYPSSYYDWRCR